MKITDPEIIRTGERELIESVRDDLDWGAIGEIVKQRINLSSVDSTQGEIVVHENKVAFRIDFILKMDLTLMFDRDGVLISDGDGGQEDENPDDKALDQAKDVVETSEYSSEGGEEKASGVSPVEEGEDAGVEPPNFDLSDLDLEGDDLTDDEVGEALDDDIDEILKESRDFWENKKSE